jgi:hypothetical protein
LHIAANQKKEEELNVRLILGHYTSHFGLLGYGRTVKFVVDVVDPPALVTVIGPIVAPLGTVAVTVFVDFTVNAADVPLNDTLVAPTKLLPEIVTFWPTFPLVGVNLATTGFGAGRPFAT